MTVRTAKEGDDGLIGVNARCLWIPVWYHVSSSKPDDVEILASICEDIMTQGDYKASPLSDTRMAGAVAGSDPRLYLRPLFPVE